MDAPQKLKASPKKPKAVRRCGAKLRSGWTCSAPPVKGKTRCFKHGGAPRSGAPRGNSNAFKSGTYTDGRNGASETRLAQIIEARMTNIALHEPFEDWDDVIASQAEHARGLALADKLRLVASYLDKMLEQQKRMEPLAFSIKRGERDALRLLLSKPFRFESAKNFRQGVSVTFHARLLARKRLKDDGRTDRLAYSLAWGQLCRGLFVEGWPEEVPGAKADKPQAQS